MRVRIASKFSFVCYDAHSDMEHQMRQKQEYTEYIENNIRTLLYMCEA